MTQPSDSPNQIRILHTADWHLGKRLERFSRLDEQRAVLAEICEIAEREEVDVVCIAGDIYDTFNPPIEAVEIFYKFVKRLANNGRRPVVAIAGNHDSPDRFETPDPLARECGILLMGYPNSQIAPFDLEGGFSVARSEQGFLEIQMPDKPPFRVLATPYANENRLKTSLGFDNPEEEMRELLANHWKTLAGKYCDRKGVNILMTHLFVLPPGQEEPEEADDEKPILHVGGAQVVYTSAIPDQIQYTALGHIHRSQSMREKPQVRYSGSPISYSMSEAGQQKSVTIIDAVPGKDVTVKQVLLGEGKSCLRKSFEDVPTALQWLSEHQNALVEITIRSETYLKAEERQALYEAHSGIVAIIPELLIENPDSAKNRNEINLERKTEELFSDYFQSRFEQKPSRDLLNLLKEVLSEEDE